MAVAVDNEERSVAELRVRSGPRQLERLLQWAEQFPDRTAVENDRPELPVGPAAATRRCRSCSTGTAIFSKDTKPSC